MERICKLSFRTSQPISWHEAFLGSMRDLYDESVWSLRHCIRGSERSRTSLSVSDDSQQPDFLHLHEIARHVIHSNECLDVAIDTIERIGRDFKSRIQPESEVISNFLSKLASLEKDVRGIKQRSDSLQERLQNEINLVSLHHSGILHKLTVPVGVQPSRTTRQPHHGSDGRSISPGQQ
jgi:hypothetical protein